MSRSRSAAMWIQAICAMIGVLGVAASVFAVVVGFSSLEEQQRQSIAASPQVSVVADSQRGFTAGIVFNKDDSEFQLTLPRRDGVILLVQNSGQGATTLTGMKNSISDPIAGFLEISAGGELLSALNDPIELAPGGAAFVWMTYYSTKPVDSSSIQLLFSTGESASVDLQDSGNSTNMFPKYFGADLNEVISSDSRTRRALCEMDYRIAAENEPLQEDIEEIVEQACRK